MERIPQIILSATTASFLTVTWMAQNIATANPLRSADALDRRAAPPPERVHGPATASDLIGMPVNDHQHLTLACAAPAVDLESGRMVQVIPPAGGSPGVDVSLSAVPPGRLPHDSANKLPQLEADKERLKSAPESGSAKCTGYSDRICLAPVWTYYSQEHAAKFRHEDAPADGTANTTTTRTSDRTRNKNCPVGKSQRMIPASLFGHVQRAGDPTGASVKDRVDQGPGTVNELMAEVHSEAMAAAVISSRGFLGPGDELTAVPPSAFILAAGHQPLRLETPTTRDASSAKRHPKLPPREPWTTPFQVKLAPDGDNQSGQNKPNQQG